ncbi:MAG: DNA polymerase IV [Sporichthyaceae bacterium]
MFDQGSLIEPVAAILHADLDAFYASVEQRDNPSLRGRPVIVGGGVVLAASYEAKRRGVRTAMGGSVARRLCPDAVVVPPRFEAYTAASKAVFDVFHDTTPVVEGISIDEAFLDVSGLRRLAGTPAHIAAGLRKRVLAEVGLPITVGIARTKFLAKVASKVAKPDGLLLVRPEDELTFLNPLPVSALWGVGPKTCAKLAERGIFTVADATCLTHEDLAAMVGKAAGRQLYCLARNLDPRPVRVGVRRRSIGSQSASGLRPHEPAEIDAILVNVVDRVSRRMRAADRLGRTVILRMRFGDYTRATRSHTLPEPTSRTDLLLSVARSLLKDAQPIVRERGGLTLVGLSVSELGNGSAVQLALPLVGATDPTGLDLAKDAVQRKFGNAALTRAVLLGRHTDFEMPKLPD